MNFDDQDWEAGASTVGAARRISTAWKVAAGVAVGMVLGGGLVYVAEHHLAPAADAVAGPPIERALQGQPPNAGSPPRTGPAAEPQAALPLAEPPVLAPKAASLSASGAAAAASLLDGDAEAEAAQRAAQRAAERKDRAWAEFYQKPALCDDNPTRDIMVACANQYIRARRQFEQAYGEGRH